jgi:hypothetical protein
MDGCYQNKAVGGKKIGWDVISVVINNCGNLEGRKED